MKAPRGDARPGARSARRAQEVSPRTPGRLEAAASPVPVLQEQLAGPFQAFV